MIDLHVHSNCSDGSYSPKELVEYAATHGITAFALTDHDTTAGLDEAISHAKILCEKYGQTPGTNPVEVIPGIELSTEYNGRDVHIIGLFIDYQDNAFQNQINTFMSAREERNIKMCALFEERGITIPYSELKASAPSAVITRAHYAQYLLEKGYVKSHREAFERYLGDHAPCFVPREKVSPEQAISLILASHGIPVLAHPVLYHYSRIELETLVSRLKKAGLMAIEAIYSTYAPSDTRQMQAIAKKYDLLISGGSDFHGAAKSGLQFGTGYGSLYVHEDVLDKLRAARPM